uniref:Ig-like domain-containing protein n=1 Tax=Xenopus tropicalis TaxID=8364 RepID=F6PZR7_XENTR
LASIIGPPPRNNSIPRLGMLLKILSFSPVIAVQFNVISISSVVAALGSDVLLPCHLIPEMNAEKMEIRWFKPMYRPYVHLYINGKDDYTAQMPQFAQRTELLKENITRGIFPLKIRNVTAEDSGEYYCFVESSDHHGKAAVQLQVTVIPFFCLLFGWTVSDHVRLVRLEHGVHWALFLRMGLCYKERVYLEVVVVLHLPLPNVK